MSSFSEISVAAAPEIPESSGPGTGVGADNGASADHAPPPEQIISSNLSDPVYQPPEDVVSTNPDVVMNEQKIDDGPVVVPAPEATVYQPEAVVVAAPEAVHSSVLNNEVLVMNSQTDPPPVMNDETNEVNDKYDPSGVSNDLNNNNTSSNEFVDYENNGIGNSSVGGVGEAMKRKRGRPRKYPISAEAASTHDLPMPMQSTLLQAGSSQKRGRGRPAGSANKHKSHAPSPSTNNISPAISGSSTAAGFMPYFITVRRGEYVQPTLLSLSQVDKQVVCVLSASGNLSNVTLQQPSSSGGTVTYQGCFEILSLSGSFLLSESGGRRSITGGLSVSLAVPNGCIFGGGVAGPLIAESDVQIIVGTFLASEQQLTIPRCNEVLTTPPNLFSSVGETPPPSRGLLSESSGAAGSLFNQSNGGFNNGNQQPFPKVAWM